MGLPAIAAHLGMSERQARHLAQKKAIPVFKLPKSALFCARRERLDAFLVEQEAAAQSS